MYTPDSRWYGSLSRSLVPTFKSNLNFLGRDCIGGARTGSGKTIAFAAPMIAKWAEDPFGVCGLVLTPTRELAIQIADQFAALGSSVGIKTCVVIGGMEMAKQSKELKEKPHFVIATPGRLADEILSNGEEVIPGLKRVKYLVLDEADRLLNPTMAKDLSTCISALAPPEKRQTLLFTATVTDAVRELQNRPQKDGKKPVFIQEVSSDAIAIPETLEQTYIFVPGYVREVFVHSILTHEDNVNKSAIVFVNRTSTCEQLKRTLEKMDIKVVSLHSEMPQRDRINALAKFRAESARVLIATDVASRGLDIPTVAMVINMEIPADADDYVHRVGRTARAGRRGEAISLVSEQDVGLIHKVEDRVGKQMAKYEKIDEDEIVANSLRPVMTAKREAIIGMEKDGFGELRKTREKKRNQRDMANQKIKEHKKKHKKKKSVPSA